MHGNGSPSYNESVRVCRELMLCLIHLYFICMHKNKPFHRPTSLSQSSFNGTLSRRPLPQSLGGRCQKIQLLLFHFHVCHYCRETCFCWSWCHSYAGQADLTLHFTEVFYVALDARGPEEARLNSFVLSVELREPGNESIVHLQDEPGD